MTENLTYTKKIMIVGIRRLVMSSIIVLELHRQSYILEIRRGENIMVLGP